MKKFRCTQCRDYFPLNQAVKVGISSYCSVQHRNDYQDGLRKRSQALTRRRQEDHKPAKDESKLKDGLRCRYCRTVFGLHSHHVIYLSEGGVDENNLLTLCMEHHDLVHSEKKKYQPLCLGMIWMREVEGNTRITIPELEALDVYAT